MNIKKLIYLISQVFFTLHYNFRYEIILQSERLVGKHYQRLRAPGCDSVVKLTQSVVRLIPEVVDVLMRPELITHINSLIDILERLSIRDRYVNYLK